MAKTKSTKAESVSIAAHTHHAGPTHRFTVHRFTLVFGKWVYAECQLCAVMARLMHLDWLLFLSAGSPARSRGCCEYVVVQTVEGA